MKRVLCCLMILLVGCSPESLGPPPVDMDTLVPVIVDVQIAESLVGEIPNNLRDSMRQIYMEKVLADHEMTPETFDSLLWIIRKEPDWLAAVFSAVSDEMAKRDADAKRIPEKVKPENSKQ